MYIVCIMQLSEQVRLIELLFNRYNLGVRHLQVMVKIYRQHTYLTKTLKYSRLDLYANATFSSRVVCCKYYISMN